MGSCGSVPVAVRGRPCRDPVGPAHSEISRTARPGKIAKTITSGSTKKTTGSESGCGYHGQIEKCPHGAGTPAGLGNT